LVLHVFYATPVLVLALRCRLQRDRLA
jgi:hypothetical protein